MKKKILEEYLNILDNNIQDTFNFETKTINYEKILDKKEIAKMVKFIENNKKVLIEYIKKLNDAIFGITDNFELKLNQKEVGEMVKFIEKNKKIFSCYEKSVLYIKCATIMKFFDPYLAYEYLEKALKYSENRNFYYEKLTLSLMNIYARDLRSETRSQFAGNKFREFWEKYYPDQKKFIELCINEYIRF